MVCRDRGNPADRAICFHHQSHARIHRLNALDGRVQITGVPDHIRVCKVHETEIIFFLFDLGNQFLRDLDRAHIRLEVVGLHARRRYEDAILIFVNFFLAAIEKVGDVRVLFRFRNAQLFHFFLGN